jgi:hypothetical protein
MAAPIISNVAVAYPVGQTTLRPGQVATITVTASDPDAQVITLTVVAEDSSNNESAPATVQVTIADPLTFSATASAGTVTPIAGQPGKFNYTF